MKKIVILGIGASMFFLGSCVESSQKYKSLQARLDSLSTVHIMQNSEMESMLADLNDISPEAIVAGCRTFIDFGNN